jgi:hypothetical protein
MKTLVAAALAFLLAAGVARAAEKAQTSAGVVKEYSAAERTFSVEDENGRTVRFVWGKDTKFNGVVSAGARVTVRYTEQGDGRNLAQTVGVLK